jgi:hypothetical protein
MEAIYAAALDGRKVKLAADSRILGCAGITNTLLKQESRKPHGDLKR